MKCKHPAKYRLDLRWCPVMRDGHEVPSWQEPIHVNICGVCLYWLPLGPANDTDERVRVEKRAAMLSQPHGAFLLFSATEFAGWLDHQRTVHPPEYADTLAGYLARQIATHDQEEHAP